MSPLSRSRRDVASRSVACRAFALLLLFVALLSGSEAAFAISRVGGSGACFSALGLDETSRGRPCPAMHGVFGATGFANDLQTMAMSPDGRHIYVAAPGKAFSQDIFYGPRDSSLLTFARDAASGRLVQVPGPSGCQSARPHPRCVTAKGISNISDVVVSLDGRFVYTSAYDPDGVAIFERDAATGVLHQLPGPQGCLLNGAGSADCTYAPLVVIKPEFGTGSGLSLSRDGRHLYALGRPLQRDSQNGTVTLPSSSTCPADAVDPSCVRLRGFPVPIFTHDGRHAYELFNGGVRGLQADPHTGSLRRMAGAPPCWPASRRGSCDFIPGGSQNLALSPDDRHLYVTLPTDDAIVPFARDPASGLIQRQPRIAVCGGRSTRAPCPQITEGLTQLAFSPNGHRAIAIMSDTLVAYRRHTTSGRLTRVGWPRGCVTAHRPSRGCARTGFADHESAVISPDDRFIYVLGLRTLAVYRL